MNWSDLQLFLAAARASSAAEAARRLQIDQATVSRRIRALEKSLRSTLFQRDPRGHALTAAGERLLTVAEEVESTTIRAYRDIAERDLAVSGPVRIAGPEGFLTAFLSPRIGELREQHPSLEIQLIPMPRLLSVSKREADIAIAVGRLAEGRAVTRKICDYSLGLFATRRYLDVHAPVRAPEDLLRHSLIGYVDDLIGMPDLDYFDEIQRGLHASMQSSSLLSQVAMTLSGAGICVLPHYMASAHRSLQPVLPAQVRLVRSYWTFVHGDLKGLTRIRTVVDFLAMLARQQRQLLLPTTPLG